MAVPPIANALLTNVATLQVEGDARLEAKDWAGAKLIVARIQMLIGPRGNKRMGDQSIEWQNWVDDALVSIAAAEAATQTGMITSQKVEYVATEGCD